MPRFTIAYLLTGCLVLFGGMVSCERADEPETLAAEAEELALEPILCRVEVRSFIVAGRGRHRAPADRSGAARVAKMTAGRPLQPIIQNADDRLETEFEVLLEQAICLQQDRVFMARYALMGTNSSSGLRRAMELCDCELPSRITNAGGFFGDFPGIDQDSGRVIERELWPSFGIEGEPLIPAPEADFQPTDAMG